MQIAAGDAGFNDHYGRALDVSGNTAVTSSRYDEHSGLAFAGSAYVLVQSGSGWTEQAKLIAEFYQQALPVLAEEKPANGFLMRGIAHHAARYQVPIHAPTNGPRSSNPPHVT